MTFLLRRTICAHLRRSRPEKILNVFQRIRLRFFRACGLAYARTSLASSRTAMSDRLLMADPDSQNRPVRQELSPGFVFFRSEMFEPRPLEHNTEIVIRERGHA